MNRQNIQKLSLFLEGLEQRIVDNTAFFKGMTAVYRSGAKDYTAKITMASEKLKVNFNGNTEILEVNLLSARLLKHVENYDSVTVTYEERGTTIFIEADGRNVKMSTRQADIEDITKPHDETSHIGNRDYLIKVGHADELLKGIGILTDEGKVRNDMIRKYNQIDHFVELICPMLMNLVERYEHLTVLDCGCGKSYLSFALNYYIKEVLKKNCHFIGLDNSKIVIEASKRIAQNLRYQNMEFMTTDIEKYSTDMDVHLVISLHACDTATDEAIALAVRNDAKAMVVVPCCHRELLNQYSFQPFDSIIKHGILKARMADAITDGMRALMLEALGYKVSVVEYISPLETPKNLMIRAEKLYQPSSGSLEEYRRLRQMLNASPALERLIYEKELSI